MPQWRHQTLVGSAGRRRPTASLRHVGWGFRSWLWLLIMVGICSGCAGFARRWQRDEVVSARQIAQQGMDAFHSGDWPRASKYLAQAVDVCPVDERIRSRYAETLWNLGSHRAAIEHLREAVRLSGSDPELVVRLGEMYLAEGDLHQADQLASSALDSGRDLAAAHRLRGDVLQRKGQWREALAAYQRALSIQPQYVEVQLAVAQVYYRNGRPQRALATLRTLADAYSPGEEPAELPYWQGLACAALGRNELAAEYWTMAETRGLASADLLYQLAEVRWQSGDNAGGAETLRHAMQCDPQHPQATRLCELMGQSHQQAIPR